ncbi:hypothetical protein PY257_02580 [Ramlibacter sp. H39-3-26]|uniref:hypothetical protein n=1 Tax=Curvibacter soli TaxID=3031331 RepID=UPI0023DC75B5|nr:hypothetical protein [Ramlibacter sp. H39-3-26]MDF1484077.1 hypothetical protein [Ramlibacter sp. H39-3-26]
MSTLAPSTSPRGRGATGFAQGGGGLPQYVGIGGWVRHPRSFDAGDLERIGAVDIRNFVVRCTVDGEHGGARSMRAVPLRALIGLSEPAFAERTDFKRAAIVAVGIDDYRALFSWTELFHTTVGNGVFLAFDSPLARLDARTGPFALLSLHDEFTGPRFVRQLASVELHRLW